MTLFPNPRVAEVFESYPPKLRRKLLALRELILETAKTTEGVGEIEETLKWGEPAYLTTQTRSGSTVRVAWKKSAPTQYAIYFNCHTNLIDTFRAQFSKVLHFEGKRAIVFDENDRVPKSELSACIATALTYHRDKKSLRS